MRGLKAPLLGICGILIGGCGNAGTVSGPRDQECMAGTDSATECMVDGIAPTDDTVGGLPTDSDPNPPLDPPLDDEVMPPDDTIPAPEPVIEPDFGEECEPNAESPCWFDDAWAFRTPIFVSAIRVGEVDHEQFPLLVSTAQPVLRQVDMGGHMANPGAEDLVFTAGDGVTELKHELESFDPTTGRITAWVTIPALSATEDTLLYAYYGGPAVQGKPDTGRVWDESFLGVWHMGAGVNGQRRDSSRYRNHGEPQEFEGDESSEGLIGSADELDGTDWMSFGHDPSLNLSGSMTMSCWMKVDKHPGKDKWFNLLNKQDFYGLYLGGHGKGKARGGAAFRINSIAYDSWDEGSVNVEESEWVHLAVSFDGNRIRGFVNGELDYSVVAPGPVMTRPNIDLTLSYLDGEDGALVGMVDEVRLSGVQRSAAWIGTSYRNQSAPGDFHFFGPEQQRLEGRTERDDVTPEIPDPPGNI